MLRIVIASGNPVKLKAVRNGFQRVFPSSPLEFQTVQGLSKVPDQPSNDHETLQGALARVEGARFSVPEADYWVGIEGGIDVIQGEMCAFAWIVIESSASGGLIKTGKARTGTFFLPPEIAKMVQGGIELGAADDIVFGRENSKQANGAIGLLTGDIVDRTSLYEQAVVLAMVPFINPTLY